MIVDALLTIVAAALSVAEFRYLAMLWRSHRYLQIIHDAHLRRENWLDLQAERKRIYR